MLLPSVLGGEGRGALAQLASRKGDGAARLTMIGSLGRLGGTEARETLQKILDDGDQPEKVRKAAFRALRRLQRQAARTERFANA